jgi:NAD(P)-dependent dehydrogenase (short-subunit alcohol dehydrogenase family)
MRDKVIVITGGFGALARGVREAALAQGARVALIDYAPSPTEFANDPLALGGVDITKFDAAQTAITKIKDAAGRIDALLNIAGGFVWKPLAEADGATWDRMYEINVKTALNATKAALPYLEASRGAIVNVGAAAALKAGAGMGAYAASKAGVLKLTESLAEELKGKVRVNAVLPSVIDTAANRKDMPNADFANWVQPAELANVMLFLASDAASAVTGALVPVTGRV